MTTWKSFLDTLDTPGGHVMLLTFLVAGGVGMSISGIAEAKEILIGSFAALLALLRGVEKNNGAA